MSNHSIRKISRKTGLKSGRSLVQFTNSARVAAATLALLMVATGCQTPTPAFKEFNEQNAVKSDEIVLREGDAVRISFPGAPNLNMTQQIRRDGRISLPLVGEFKATGMTPSQMEKELIKLYEPQLQTK